MANNIEVKEKDIFNFVFNQSALAADLLKKIESDPIYKNRIEYYKDMQNVLGGSDPDDADLSKIASKIDAFKPSNRSAQAPQDSIENIHQSSAET